MSDLRVRIGKIWIAIGEMYGKQISQSSLSIMLRAIEDLDEQDVMNALNSWVKTSKIPRPPTPAEIRNLINPVLDDKFLANDLAQRILGCVSKFGYTWDSGFFNGFDNAGKPLFYFKSTNGVFSTFKEAVISEIGEIAWHVVCVRGGWQNLVESANLNLDTIFFAQLRDQIESSTRLARDGVDVTAIEYPKKKIQGLTKFGMIER